MKIPGNVILSGLSLFFISYSASAHYIFDTLIYGGQLSSTAVRVPRDNSPVKPVDSPGMTCNVNTNDAKDTVNIPAGSEVGFKVSGGAGIYHSGPGAIYLGKAPGLAKDWNGSGCRWFKIAEWGATFNPFRFITTGQHELVTTIPNNTAPGEYLLRVEHIGLHVIPPESFVSCAQIKISGTGTGRPRKVPIPGYLHEQDSSVSVNIYYPVPTEYRCPGPSVWRG